MADRNEFLEKEYSALETKKTRVAYLLAVVVLIAAGLIGYWFTSGSSLLVGFLCGINLLFGPVTLFFYLREVKKGIFRADVDADMQEGA